MIVGQPGSGKSTLARRLGDLTGLPVLHMDRIHWTPGWIERPRTERIVMVKEHEARDRWIIEGGLSETWPNRRARADLLIWLDIPTVMRLLGVLQRRVTYRGGESRPDLPRNCPERLDLEFLRWIWKTRRTHRERMRALVDGAGNTPTLTFCSRAAVNAYLRGYSSDQPARSRASPTTMPTNRR